jgi:peptide/nickel transport system substrate-binding protein
MTDFSSPAVGLTGLTLNNTWVFGEQDKAGRRTGRWRTSTVLALAASAALLTGSVGCRSSRKKDASGDGNTGAGASKSDKNANLLHPVALAPPLEMATLPLPGAPPAPGAAATHISRTGGTLRVHLDSEPPHLNPLADGDASIGAVVNGLVYETLLECTPDGYQPALADHWVVSSDGLRIVLHVRPGIRWHDHHVFSGVDVQGTLERVMRSSSALPLARSDLSDVNSVEIAADHVVRLNLRRRSDLTLRALCDIPILPDHLMREGSAESPVLAKQPIGTGPFKFLAWDRGKRIRLGRFNESWRPAAPLDEIVFDLEPDAVRALNRTRRGDLDVLPRVLDAHYPEQVEPATLHGTVTLYRLAPERTSFLVVNHRRFPLGDPQFRRALALLWDRARFAHELHKDLAHPIGGPTFGPSTPTPFDRPRAQALLQDAGYRDNDADGVRDRAGRPIRLSLLQTTGSRSLALEAHAFTLELRKAGILLDIVPADAPTILARLRKGDFDLAPMVWEGRPDEDPSPLYDADGIYNFGGYRSTAVQAALDDLHAAAGPAERRPILARLAGLIAEDQPIIFLYRQDVPALISNRVAGVTAVGDRLDLRHAWIAP